MTIRLLNRSGKDFLYKTAWASARPVVAILDRARVLTAIPGKHLLDILTDFERNHITKLENANLRSRYLAGRAVLRLFISDIAGLPAPEKLFNGGDTGAPLAVECADGRSLSFSVSHSGKYSLFGFSKTGRVGVDIEAQRPVRQMLDAAEYAFSPEEAAWLRTLPADTAMSAFFRIWTRKEAVVKFLKGTVAHDMHRFTVPLDAAMGCYNFSPHLPEETGELRLADFTFNNGFYGAVCWEGTLERLRAHRIGTRLLIRSIQRYRKKSV